MSTFDPRRLRALADAACLCWVRDVDPGEVLRRLGGQAPFASRTLAAVDAELSQHYDPFRGLPCGGVADLVGDGWTLLVEPNGFQATVAGRLEAIAEGADAISVFWNVNALTELAVVRAGAVRAVLPELISWVPGDEGAPQLGLADVEGDASEVEDLVAALARVPGFDWERAVFPWVARRTGAVPDDAWFAAAHPSAAFIAR